MKLELDSFERAIEQLAMSLDYAQSDLAKQDKGLFNQFRNSVIQCFEFTYELSWKMLKRFIEKNTPTLAIVDQFNFNELIRLSAEQNLIRDPKLWFDFRNMRNITAHTYNENKAQEIYQNARKASSFRSGMDSAAEGNFFSSHFFNPMVVYFCLQYRRICGKGSPLKRFSRIRKQQNELTALETESALNESFPLNGLQPIKGTHRSDSGACRLNTVGISVL